MIAALFAILVCTAAWVAWALLPIPVAIPIVVTVLLAILAIGAFVHRRMRATRAARALEKSIAAQAKEHEEGVRPDQRAEIEQIRIELEKAVGALKKSQLGGGGARALYELPWYLLIGPSGAGKSTALRGSGLQFPYVSDTGSVSVRGVGGTRNCDWWLTNEAVLLDTAGRFTTDDEDREQWLAFLEMVKKSRSQKPLDGILCAVGVSEIAGARDEEIAALARKLRERIDEVLSRLELSLPVYLLFTKCDLVPGFVETFADLSKTERGQVLGFTAASDGVVAPEAFFAEKMRELARAQEQRALARIADERDPVTRGLVFAFPQQLEALERPLGMFVESLFAKNVFSENPIFRGAYFTSGTQEGRPIDRVMNRLAEAFGLRSTVFERRVASDPKSYFLTDVFRNVVFPDRELAVRSVAATRKRARKTFALAALVLLFAALITAIPGYSYVTNRTYLATTASLVGGVSSQQGFSLEALEALRGRMDQLDRYESEGAPLAMRFGMYVGDAMHPVVERTYVRALRAGLVEPIAAGDARFLARFAAAPTEREASYAARLLRAHLLLTAPAEANQPPLEGDEATFLTQHLEARARAELGGDARSGTLIDANVALFVRLLAKNPQRVALVRDADLVTRTRRALQQTATSGAEIERIIASLEGSGFGLRLDQVAPLLRPITLEPDYLSLRLCRRDGGDSNTRCSVDQYDRSRSVVRGAFTKRGYDAVVRPLLSGNGAGVGLPAWVAGPRSVDTTSEERLAALRTEYFRAYRAEWDAFLHALRMTEGRGSELSRLRDLTQTPTPHTRLFELVESNATLESSDEPEGPNAAETLAELALNRVRRRLGNVDLPSATDATRAPEERHTATTVRDYLREFTRFGVAEHIEGQPDIPVQLEEYLAQLRLVANALEQAEENPAEAGDAVVARLEEARGRTQELIHAQSAPFADVFENVLWPPLEAATEGSMRAEAGAAGQSFCTEVVSIHDATLAGRYPFNPRGQDASLEDFAAFYAPETGVLWGFYGSTLSRHVAQRGASFELERRLGQDGSSVYRRAIVPFLERSHEVTSAFFPRGAVTPRVDFEVRIMASARVAQTELSLGGQTINYQNGPEQWTRMSWPGEDPMRGATIRVRGAGVHDQLRQEGAFGLFRILEQGTVVSGGGGTNVFTVVFHLAAHDIDVTMSFRPLRAESPFFGSDRGQARLLRPMRSESLTPPRDLSVAGAGCPRAR